MDKEFADFMFDFLSHKVFREQEMPSTDGITINININKTPDSGMPPSVDVNAMPGSGMMPPPGMMPPAAGVSGPPMFNDEGPQGSNSDLDPNAEGPQPPGAQGVAPDTGMPSFGDDSQGQPSFYDENQPSGPDEDQEGIGGPQLGPGSQTGGTECGPPMFNDEGPGGSNPNLDPNAEVASPPSGSPMGGQMAGQVDPNTGQPLDPNMMAQGGGMGMPGGDPNAMPGGPGGMPPMPGGDPNAMGGMPPMDPNAPPGQDPSMGGMPGGDTNAPPPQIDPNTGQPMPTDPNAPPPGQDPNAQGDPNQQPIGQGGMPVPPSPIDILSQNSDLLNIHEKLIQIDSLLETFSHWKFELLKQKLEDGIELFNMTIANQNIFSQTLPQIVQQFRAFIEVTLKEIYMLNNEVTNDEHERGVVERQKHISDQEQQVKYTTPS